MASPRAHGYMASPRAHGYMASPRAHGYQRRIEWNRLIHLSHASGNLSLSDQKIPAEFLERLHAIVGSQEYDAVRASFDAEKHTAARINLLKSNFPQVAGHLHTAQIAFQTVDWLPTALTVQPLHRENLTRLPLVNDGSIYIQGLSSMLAALILDPRPGQQVLDLAAAPGGKASHLAELMNNTGRLSVVEPIRKRMYVLADHLKRMGVTIAKTYLVDGRKVGRKTPNRFDRVLLDAPCSSEARIHRHQPESWRYWSLRKIAEQARKQRGLLKSAFESLRPGGTLLYCTCSFAPEENESVVEHLLSLFPDHANLEAIELPIEVQWQSGLLRFAETIWSETMVKCRRLLPSEYQDALFLAKISKSRET